MKKYTIKCFSTSLLSMNIASMRISKHSHSTVFVVNLVTKTVLLFFSSLEQTKSAILPELVELTKDEERHVQLAGLETVVEILSLLDDGEFMFFSF